jgi:hypothetical protein
MPLTRSNVYLAGCPTLRLEVSIFPINTVCHIIIFLLGDVFDAPSHVCY